MTAAAAEPADPGQAPAELAQQPAAGSARPRLVALPRPGYTQVPRWAADRATTDRELHLVVLALAFADGAGVAIISQAAFMKWFGRAGRLPNTIRRAVEEASGHQLVTVTRRRRRASSYAVARPRIGSGRYDEYPNVLLVAVRKGLAGIEHDRTWLKLDRALGRNGRTSDTAERLGAELKKSARTVRRHIEVFERIGLIAVERSSDGRWTITRAPLDDTSAEPLAEAADDGHGCVVNAPAEPPAEPSSATCGRRVEADPGPPAEPQDVDTDGGSRRTQMAGQGPPTVDTDGGSRRTRMADQADTDGGSVLTPRTSNPPSSNPEVVPLPCLPAGPYRVRESRQAENSGEDEHQDEPPDASATAAAHELLAWAGYQQRPTPTEHAKAATVVRAIPPELRALIGDGDDRLPGRLLEVIVGELSVRTAGQLCTRVARRWDRWGCQAALAQGRIRNPRGLAITLVAAGDCADVDCEDGVRLRWDGSPIGPCEHCGARVAATDRRCDAARGAASQSYAVELISSALGQPVAASSATRPDGAPWPGSGSARKSAGPCAHGDPGGCHACAPCRHGTADPEGRYCVRDGCPGQQRARAKSATTRSPR